MSHQPPDVLERDIQIAARPETIFAFFTDPAKMLRWMGRDVILDARPCGICRIDMNGHDIARGEFVEITPYTRVVFTFGWEGEGATPPPGGSTVEISLIPNDEGTLVRLRHIGLDAAERNSHGEGWDFFLPRLVVAAEGREQLPGASAM